MWAGQITSDSTSRDSYIKKVRFEHLEIEATD